MKGVRIFFLLLSALLPVFSFAETYTVEVGQFEKLKINGDIRIIYKNLPDSAGYARYSAPIGNNDIFSFSLKGDGTLKTEPNNEKWGITDLPVLYLYSSFLSSVESFSNLEVEIERVAPCATFNVNQVGNGKITVDGIKSNNVTASISTGNGSIFLSGQCINANFRMVGAGMISADRLLAENVKCRILGTGSIGCWPVDNLNVTGIGSTKIYYKGRPNIKKSGGGKLFALPEDDNPDKHKGTEVPSFDEPASSYDNLSTPEGDDDDDYRTVVTQDD